MKVAAITAKTAASAHSRSADFFLGMVSFLRKNSFICIRFSGSQNYKLGCMGYVKNITLYNI
jgi:hypothetical protein